MKLKGLSRSSRWHFRPRLCQACLSAVDVVNPKQPNNDFIEKEEINHKEIRQNALQLMRKGMITHEEYILVLDADLKYEAGLELASIGLDLSALSPSISHSSSTPGPATSNMSPRSPTASSAPSQYTPPDGQVDPITLELLGDNIFSFTTPQGNIIKYNITSLVEYISSSGDFRDPVTRFPLSTEDISTIDKQLSSNTANQYLSTLRSIRENSHFYCIQRQKKEECQNLETCLGEMVVEMLDIIESPTMGPKTADAAELRMFMLCSEFEPPFQLLKSLDIEHARQCQLRWMVFLRGTPRRPTVAKGPRGVMKSATAFLEGLWGTGDEEKLKIFKDTFA